MSAPTSNITSEAPLTKPPSTEKKPKDKNKRSFGENIMSILFDGPRGTESQRNAKELRDKWEEDKLDIPRTDKEEKARQARNKKRAEISGGGDGVRTNDMQKGGWGGTMLGPA